MTAITTSEMPAMSGRLRGLSSGAREIEDAPVRVQGELPAWLRGGLLLNGPALWELPQGGFRHWFDGLAMAHRVSLGEGGARYRSRYLRTSDYEESVAAGRPAYQGFGTPDPAGFWRRMRHLRNPRATDNAAVALARIGAQWVAQTETPHLLGFDPKTLASTGRIAFEDDLVLHLMSAHGITAEDGTYWNVGVELGPRCTYKVFKVRPGSRRREVVGQWAVRKSGYLHAFALTPGHVVVWEPAMRAQPLKFLFSGNSYIDNFRWEPAGGSRINVVSRSDGTVRSWSVPPMMAFHAVQAYEEGDDIVLELCTAEPAVFDALYLDRVRAGRPVDVPHRVMRYRLQAGRGEAMPQPLMEGVDLPMVHGAFWTRRAARYAWAAGFDPAHRAPMLDRTVKLDMQAGAVIASWQRGDAVQLEPLYVERPGSSEEHDGVLLVPTLADGDAGTVVCVVEPASMRCMATLELPQVVPFGFHAAWDPD
jgi:carotenoid cleavage dioxygenase-like enzyme